MPELQEMPEIRIPQEQLAETGAIWLGTEGSVDANGTPRSKQGKCFDKKQGMEFGRKTLNDESSIRKNWQNMINDLASLHSSSRCRCQQ